MTRRAGKQSCGVCGVAPSGGKRSFADIGLVKLPQVRVPARFCLQRLTEANPGLYCAPFRVKGDFRDLPAIDGVRISAILRSLSPAFVVAGYSLKIRTGNLCGDSRHMPLVQLMMSSKRPVVHS